MADRHAARPITWRPARDQREQLEARAAELGVTTRLVVGVAVAEYLARLNSATSSPAEVAEFNRSARVVDELQAAAAMGSRRKRG